ncbi:hypothetical protein EV363DRAFT_637116 [Boletus edulis]|nr:hypothetical protein EV363DRAFT_637116 [Boletus edulis]
MSSNKRRKRAAARLVFAPPPRRSSSPHCSSSPVSAHPPTTPCLHSHSGASQLTSLGSGAREPDCRADAPARRSHPPSQLTPHPASRAPVPGRRALHALAHPLPLSSIHSLSASSSRRPRVQSDVQRDPRFKPPGLCNLELLATHIVLSILMEISINGTSDPPDSSVTALDGEVSDQIGTTISSYKSIHTGSVVRLPDSSMKSVADDPGLASTNSASRSAIRNNLGMSVVPPTFPHATGKKIGCGRRRGNPKTRVEMEVHSSRCIWTDDYAVRKQKLPSLFGAPWICVVHAIGVPVGSHACFADLPILCVDLSGSDSSINVQHQRRNGHKVDTGISGTC